MHPQTQGQANEPKYSGVPAKAALTNVSNQGKWKKGRNALFVRSFSVMLSLQSPKSAAVAQRAEKLKLELEEEERTTERKVSRVVCTNSISNPQPRARVRGRTDQDVLRLEIPTRAHQLGSTPLTSSDSPIHDVEGMQVIECT